MEFIEVSSDNIEDFSNFIDEDLMDDMDRAFFKGIGAVDGVPAGLLVYELVNSESEEDTKSRIRLINAGNDEIKNGLIKRYREAIAEDEVVESFYETEDEALADILSAEGFSKEQSEGEDLTVTMADVKKLAAIFKSAKAPSFIINLTDSSVMQYRTFIKNCLFKGTKGILEDLAYLPKTWFDTDVSTCAVTDEEVTGALLIRQAPSGTLHAMLYTAYGPDYQKNLSLILANTVLKSVEAYGEDTKLVIRRHNETVRKLTDKLFAGKTGSKVYTGMRSEG